MNVLRKRKTGRIQPKALARRRRGLLGLLLLCMVALAGRAIFLQGFDTQFLQKKGDNRHVGKMVVSAYRGKILDRNNEPLAISTPVNSVCVDPRLFKADEEFRFRKIGKLLGVSDNKINHLLNTGLTRKFAYLKRHITPEMESKVKALQVSGVYFKRELKRYYPAGAISSHIIGFTDIDDVGQEGLERGYEPVLKGVAGKKTVVRDGKRRIIRHVDNIKTAVPGQDIILSIDQRIQYLAFKALQAGFLEHEAASASLVVLDAKNGEVLAAVNQPAFNPNMRKNLRGAVYRNRAILDIFEPGSTVKPFVVAAALDGEFVDPDIQIETQGIYKVGRNVVRDTHNYGTIDLMHLLKKSSNIAASKVALMMPAEYFWGIYSQLGFGTAANIGFPGEASGFLPDFQGWNKFEQATLSYGYGVSTSALQLARAYTALADNGVLHSVSLLKRDEDYDTRQVFTTDTAKKVREMLEHVVEKGGTAYQARVDGFRVAGKTGTAKKVTSSGYAENTYQAVFAGMAPASDPRFVIVVMVDEPSAGKFYGGQVAAPIFSKVMAGALRIYGVVPDKEDTMPVLLTKAE